MQPTSANFDFLRAHGQQLFRLAAQAEHYFRTDPNTTLMKLRQFAELLAKEVAARTGSLRSADDRFFDLLGELGRSGYVPGQAMTLFHQLRTAGNEAIHGDLDDFAVALTRLKVARQLAVWFVRSYGGQRHFNPGPFVPPPAPVDPTIELREQLEALRAVAESHKTAAEIAQARAEALARENLDASERLRREEEERLV